MLQKIKRFLIGDALPNWEYKHQRLPKSVALAVFSSDSMSSVAYATEEIVLALLTAGTMALMYALPISIAILALLWILIFSYRQTIDAYPKGGGAYSVAKDNLSPTLGLVAASALLLDYILTVSVSVAAGVAAVVSVFPQVYIYRILIGVFVIFLISLINLKGIKESGMVFSIPTYLFIISFLVMIAVGFFRFFTGTLTPLIIENQVEALSSLSLFLILRAFSSGCAALTGIEAITNGVPAFKSPESKNARTTILWMAIILTTLFFGITFLGHYLGVVPSHDRTLVSIIAESIFGRTFFFFFIQAATMMILFMAANTSFADFPRLCFFLAKDNYLPHQFKQLGDRLVFSNGIIFLGVISSIVIIAFKGIVHNLIPLYAVGVFTSFTLSQTGMVYRHFRIREKGWKKGAAINMIGAITTAVVTLIIGYTKFMGGAWIIIILILLLVLLFKKINNHYMDVAEELSVAKLKSMKYKKEKHIYVVLVPSFSKAVVGAITYARNLSEKVIAVHVDISGADTDNLKRYWKKFRPQIPLKIIESPFRKFMQPLMTYINQIEKDPKVNVTVVIPEFVPKHWWHSLLHNQTALALKTKIHFRKRTNYISLQYHLHK
ncbi:MAG: APC family permease [archaeon]